MPIKPRRRPTKRKPTIDCKAPKISSEHYEQLLQKLGEVAAAVKDPEASKLYLELRASDHAKRLVAIAKTADENKSWKHMEGCYSQAMTLYVFAGILYEQFPEHHIMSDAAFDRLAKWLLKNWNKLSSDFRNWYNITSMGFKAGTALGTTADAEMVRIVHAHTGIWIEEQHVPKRKPTRKKPSLQRGSRKSKLTTGRDVRKSAKVKRRPKAKAAKTN